ncbi:DUF1654 domain-containing protein [Vreelandella glaciei]|uniref:DUF1654 domain-containing protein n=1 Tax=Vreelandella glaciei TaxID=186761 RepID=UPI0030EF5F5E|tara:strand:+ start:208 stop:435 length:228 start_codon:yes stop_codon:yes gene_type:complete
MSKSYEQLVKRVQKEIGSPKAQSEHCVELQRQLDDTADDWAHMLSDLGTIENVDLIPLDDTAEQVRVRWNPEGAM